MSDDNVESKIEVVSDFKRPDQTPVLGDKRLVRYLPFSVGGDMKPMMLPAIWISPYEFYDKDLDTKVKFAILLFDKGPPKPEIVAVRIPSNGIEKFPLGPVEW